jgi:hypothetical protein
MSINIDLYKFDYTRAQLIQMAVWAAKLQAARETLREIDSTFAGDDDWLSTVLGMSVGAVDDALADVQSALDARMKGGGIVD